MMDIRKEIEDLPKRGKRFVRDVGKSWKKLTPLEKGAVIALGVIVSPIVGGIGFKYLESRKKRLNKVI